MTLVTLADERYALTLAVLGRSISENLSTRHATLYVVDGGITPETKQHLLASWDPQRMRVEFVAPHFGQEQELPVWGRFPPLTYARIFVPLLLPQDCPKAIVLDSDTIVLTDMERLWNIELGDNSLLAVQDSTIPLVSSEGGLGRYQELGIPPGHPYFNAGVMLVNVEKWRRTGVPGRVMEFIHQHAAELNYCDQDGLNAVLWDDWGELDSRWQVQPRLHARLHEGTQATADAWILHFTGRLKPWLYRGSTLSDRLFYQYLDRTWWSGWRPPSSPQAWLYRLYDSPLKNLFHPVVQWGNALARYLSRRSARV
ncbi:MAG: glycosyltransferase family 8 protein [Acidobacteriota bacterium]